MRGNKTPKIFITAGLLVSLIVLSRLFSVARDWLGGEDPTLLAFLLDPTRFIFAVYISVLLFAIWLVRGSNNRLIYVLWCLGSTMHYFLYWSGMEVFFYTDISERNIYVLNWLSTVCIIPLLFVLRYKSYLVICTIAFMIRFDICKAAAKSYFESLKNTDFECKLRRCASIWFAVEFAFSAYLTLFALLNNVGFADSLGQAIVKSGLPNPFPIYYWILNILTVYFALLILIQSLRDLKIPDWQSASLLSELQRKDMIKGRKPSKFDPF